jgi:predicted nucleic acid-binding protein
VAGLAAALAGHRRVGLDTSVFIYHVEGSTQFAGPAGESLEDLTRGAFEGVTSVLTLMEIAVKPLQLERPEVADEYEILLTTYPHLEVVDVDRTIARRAAELRARYRLRPADALQVATCLEGEATAFLTNDKSLRRIKEVQVLVLEDYLGG